MPVKILVADDSATMRQIMQMTFAGEDAEVVTVDSGDAAVQKAKELQPDVVFVDASMPKDGYAVAQEIKGAGVNAAVIVLASQHNPFDEDRGKEAGVDDHVLKPFDTQVVIDKTHEVLGKPRAAASAAAPPPKPPRPVASSKQTAGGGGGPPPPPPPRPAATGPSQPARTAGKSTVAFGAPNRPSAPSPSAPQPAASASANKPVLELADEEPARPAAPRAASKPATAAAAATGNGGDMAAKLRQLGLDENQVNGVLSLSREVIEQVVWEVVPDLAETIIREEIRRLTAE